LKKLLPVIFRDPSRPGIVIEDGHQRVLATPAFGTAQATPEHLGDKELTVESPLLVRDNLKYILHVLTLTEHGYRDDPFNLAGRVVYSLKLGDIRLMLLGGGYWQDLLSSVFRGDLLPIL
jgi:hypothetical protein